MKTKLLLMLVAVGLMAGATQANMLVNSSFEDGAFGAVSPDYWAHYWISYAPVHTWVSNATEAHSGSKYMRMFNWYAGSSDAFLGQIVPGVKEGKDYSFIVWAKNGGADQANEAAIFCEWLDSSDDEIYSDTVYIPVTDLNWVEIDFGALTAPEGAVAATLWLTAPLGNGANAICYDDVSMIGPDPNITAGVDMVSWDGETVSLTGTTSLDSYSTISWSADPNYCAVITNGDTLTPTVQVNPIIESGPATIANHSFENDLDDWEIIGGEGHGTWNGYADGTVYITPTDGRQCAYLNGVTAGMGTLSQVLTNNLVAANTTYTLSVDVVNDGYYEEDVAYRVQLRAGGNLLKQDNNGHALDTYGEWKTSTVTYDSGAEPTELGEPLEIRLIAKAGTNEMNFDNVRLTANPPFPAYVPDILTYTLTLDIDSKYDTMKIDAYPDSCAAKLGAGLREATDPVGDDCITNLADLAEMVKTWTDDNALTEPITKAPTGLPANAALLDGLVEYWQLNDNYNAEVTPAHEGSLTTTGTGSGTFVSGKFGQGIDLDNSSGNQAYVVIGGDENDFDFAGESMSVSAWYTTKSLYTAWQCLIAKGEGDAWRLHRYSDDAANIDFWFSISATGDGELDQQDGSWHHVVATADTVNGAANLYVDGNLVASSSGTVALTGNTAAMQIGGNPDASGRGWDGILDDIGIWNRVLTADEVSSIWNGGAGASIASTLSGVGGPSPADGAYIPPTDDLKLGWTNIDPNKPGDPVYVDVWFGTDPNKLPPPSPTYDFNKIVDAVEDANSVTVDVSTEGTYYWQVNSYIYGSATGDPIEGIMWRFHVVTDAPVSVNAGGNVITWSGTTGKVQLDASVVDDGASDLIIRWSADPNDGVVFDPNEFVENPTVTITKVTDNPSVVTLTLSAHDDISSDDDTMKIDVYDNSCLAAIGDGHEIDPGDFDADCDTDLEDYAAMAEKWLFYSGLTESIVKP